MKILVLGASGFIGNACYNYFSKNNQVSGVDVVDRYSQGLLIDPDLSTLKNLIRDSGFDLILNCAGSANIRGSFTAPEADLFSNTTYVENVLTLIKEHSCKTKFINISSAAVYGNPEKLPISETAKTNPLSPYGVHKLMSEEILHEYSRSFGIPTLTVRIFSAYGIGLRQQFFYDLYSKFKADPEQATLFGSGNESRDFIFISDILEAFGVLMHSGAFKGEVYNLASGVESFIKNTALLFAEILKYKGEIIFTNQQLEGYPLNWHADISRLKTLGFSPKIKMEQGLELYANWLKTNPA